jgi:hypothetical protein
VPHVRRARGFGGTGLLLALGGVVVLFVLLALVGLVAGGLRSETAEQGVEPAPPTTVRPPVVRIPLPPRPVIQLSSSNAEVEIAAVARDDFPREPSVIERLARRTVLRVTARGFEGGTSGMVQQCAGDRCVNPFPVIFDAEGNARFQYLLVDHVQVGSALISSCRAADPPCVVRLGTTHDIGYLATVFTDRAPAPRTVTVRAGGHGVVDGEAVQVVATGYPPGQPVRATLCAAPATSGTRRCGTSGREARFTPSAPTAAAARAS